MARQAFEKHAEMPPAAGRDALIPFAGLWPALQGRCPSQSLEDRAQLQFRVLAGDTLPAVTAGDQRSQIFDRVCSIEHVIPSIHTFFEDTKYLELPARILKELLPGKCKGSMSQHFGALHSGQTKVMAIISAALALCPSSFSRHGPPVAAERQDEAEHFA